jgi:hypothetical protein
MVANLRALMIGRNSVVLHDIEHTSLPKIHHKNTHKLLALV